jgi:hypothetical protein
MSVENDFSGFVVQNLEVVHQDRVVFITPHKINVVKDRHDKAVYYRVPRDSTVIKALNSSYDTKTLNNFGKEFFNMI